MWRRVALVAGVLGGLLAGGSMAQQGAPDDRIEALKQSFAASRTALRQYQWIETVALSLSGEEKVRQQYECYYGADGKLQKVPLAADAKEERKRGIRGKVIESKKEELQASMKEATVLLHQYVPLDPERIQAAKAAGNVSVSVPGADGRLSVTIKDYLKPGDRVMIGLDPAKNTLQSVTISSYTEKNKTKSPVTAGVNYAALEDGTLYPKTETLDISEQNLKLNVENSGYRKQAK